jgi:hypothetical protein
MKRNFLALGLLSLCCMAIFVGESQAFHGLLHPYNPFSLWHHRNRYVTHITCRPYNAFTPIAWGNLVCDGCNPNPCGVAAGCLPVTMGVPPWAYTYGMGHGVGFGPGCGDACGAGDMHHHPGTTIPVPPVHVQPQPFTAPVPGPNVGMMYPQGVSQAAFNPYMYYPQYYQPQYYQPQYYYPTPMPYYWYGTGR